MTFKTDLENLAILCHSAPKDFWNNLSLLKIPDRALGMTKYNNLSATHLGTFISYILRILKSQNITDQNTLNVQYKFGIFTEAIINSRKAKFKSL